MLKKWVSMLLCAVMLVCAAAVPSAAEAEEGEDGTPEKIRIGVVTRKTTDAHGMELKQVLDNTARALDVKIIYAEHGENEALAEETAELLCDAGCRGILYSGVSEADRENAIGVCGERGVYIVEAYAKLDEAEVPGLCALAASSEYYGGIASSDPDEETHNAGVFTGIPEKDPELNTDTAFYAFLLLYGKVAGSNGDTGSDPYYVMNVPWPEEDTSRSEKEIRKLANLSLPELVRQAEGEK